MDNKERLIAYLYGEMDETERRAFEELLTQDKVLSSELEALQQTRLRLAEVPESVPSATVITLTVPPNPWVKWAVRASAAAAVVLLLSLLNARFEVGDNGLVFALGKPAPTKVVPTLDAESLTAQFQMQLAQRDQQLAQQLLQMDSLWQDRLTAREQRLQQNWDRQLAAYQARRQKDLEAFAQYLVAQEMPNLVDLVQNLQLEQQEELRALLSGFWRQWQETRTADLQSIETEFVNLYRNVELSQTETAALLKDILAVNR